MYKKIIEDVMFPFVAEKYNYEIQLHQDNDSKHNSKLCNASLKNLGINWVCQIFSLCS